MLADQAHRGVGMLEFLIALMIFSVGIMGLLSAQLVGKKTIIEASQRSLAILLARDILERMRANPGQLSAYRVIAVGDEESRLPRPDVDCDVAQCSAGELAAFDIWQWESQLIGSSKGDSERYVGGLLAPRACIASGAGGVDVTISWYSAMAFEIGPTADCFDIDDASQRHQLTLSSFIGGQ